MSINMYLAEVESQNAAIKSMCQQHKAGMEQMKKSVSSFCLTPFLVSTTYNSAKSYFSTVYLPLLNGFILAGETMVKANQQFVSDFREQVAGTDVEEEVLKEQIRRNQQIIAAFESIKEGQFLLGRLTALLKHSGQRIHEKLTKLYGFNGSSPALYTELESLLSDLANGVRSIDGNRAWSPTSGTFNLSVVDSKSLKKLQEKWKAHEEQQAQELMEAELNKIAKVDKDGNVTDVKWDELGKLLMRNPDEWTEAEKNAVMYMWLSYGEKIRVDSNLDVFGLFEQLSGIISPFLGFQYNEDGYFYTNEHSIQSHGGFMDFYDKCGWFVGMDLDTEIFTFISGDKEYRIQLWKGSYGFDGAYGGETGIYYRDASLAKTNPYIEGTSDFIWYECAKEGFQLPMTLKIYDKNNMNKPLIENNTRDYADNEDHFWNLAIALGEGYNKENLILFSELEIEDEKLRADFVASVKKNKAVNVEVNGSVVTLKWTD